MVKMTTRKDSFYRCIHRISLLFLPAVFFLLFPHCVSLAGEQSSVTIKMATLAPDGSTWMKIMREIAAEVTAKTGDRVTFRFYPGGISGDEKDMLRKIKIGQIHAVGLTGNGLGNIVPEVRLLEIPFLFKNYEEVDHAMNHFSEYFREKFREKGYEILGWADVGFVYLFSNKPIHSVEDMEGIRMWSWEGDPLATRTFKTFGVSTIPIAVPDVMTSLQTKLIDTVYISPMACLALQWFTKISHMTRYPITHSCGAVLVKKGVTDRLSPEDREALFSISEKHLRKLEKRTREENRESIRAMEESGITMVSPSDEEIKQFDSIGLKIADSLAGELYSKELLGKMRQSVERFRKRDNGEN
jgi:TRAP-type C4-dicarboxylate transport system substrate-binding protein